MSEPIHVRVNGTSQECAAGSTLAELVAAVTPVRSGVAAAVNETVVPRGRWAGTALHDGDRVEVLTAVQGG